MATIDFKRLGAHATPEQSIGFLLWRVSTQWRSSIESTLKPLNLTHPQFVVLATLGWLTKKGERVSQVEIGRLAGLDPNTTSQILRGLESKKLIERIHSKDQRSKNPKLTAAGLKSLEQSLPAVERADREFFAGVTARDLQLLLKVFQKLIS